MENGAVRNGDRPTGLLYEWVERAALERPRSRAIVTEDEVVTYGEMNACASWLARALRARGCRRGDTVAVLMSNRARAIVSFVGVLKAGCAYVPLDPRAPLPRLESIIRRARPRVLLVSGTGWEESVEALRTRGALRGTSVGRLDTVACPSPSSFELEPAHYDVHPDDTAYVLFESDGGTEPKGVAVTHDSVRRLAEWAVEYFQLGPTDRLSGHAHLTYEMSALDIYAAFAAGAELHPVPSKAQVLPQQIISFMRERKLTFWFSVPSLLSFVARFDALPEGWLPSLRHLVWSGDVFPPKSLMYWKRRLPHAALTNLYGRSETTVASTYFRLPPDFDAELSEVPVGRPVPGNEVLLLDDEMRPVESGEVGRIHVRGAGVSRGYWNDPDRTRTAFVQDPASPDREALLYRTGDLGRWDEEGNLHLLGRADFRIRSAGRAIEAAAVENALLRMPEIGACAVVPVPNGNGDSIGCAYVASNGAAVPPRAVETRLQDVLPGHMIPGRWMRVHELPVRRGKLDRPGLRRMFMQDTQA